MLEEVVVVLRDTVETYLLQFRGTPSHSRLEYRISPIGLCFSLPALNYLEINNSSVLLENSLLYQAHIHEIWKENYRHDFNNVLYYILLIFHLVRKLRAGQ